MNVSEVLGRKFNNASGICTEDGKLTKWPKRLGKKPTVEQLKKWGSEQEAEDAVTTQGKVEALAPKAKGTVSRDEFEALKAYVRDM